MALSSDLISKFVKATRDNKKTKTGNTVYGTIETYDNKKYVRIDGSDVLTPVSTTVDLSDAADGERVAVMIKNHTAIATGNASSPAARIGTVKNLDGKVDSIYTDYVETKELVAEKATIKDLEATNANVENLTARTADIENLNADSAFVENLNAQYATITRLEVSEGKIEDLTTKTAHIETLEADSAFVANLNGKYANLNFANVGVADIKALFATSGILTNIVSEDGHITGELVGVTIKGDLIEAGTLKADRLVLRGTDGKYYAISTDFTAIPGVTPVEEDQLHGSALIKESITADKIFVTDLTAFNAKIAGLNLAEGAIYSGAKQSVDNTTEGFYIDKDGQMAVGDSANYLKYYTKDGKKILDISAANIRLGTSGRTVEESIDDAVDDISVGARNLLKNSSFKHDLSGWVHSDDCEVELLADKYGRPCAHISQTEMGVTMYVRQGILDKLEPDTTYTLSGWVLTENIVNGTTNPFCKLYTEGHYDNDGTSTWFDIGNVGFTLNSGKSGWEYVTGQLKTDSNKFNRATSLRLCMYTRDMIGDVYFSELKLEKGNKATDWTPAPEDLAKQSDMSDQMSEAQAAIEKLEKQINLMVGSSGLVVTEDGVAYVNLSALESASSETANSLRDLEDVVGDIDLTSLDNRVTDVELVAKWIAQGEDANGNPLLKLGRSDSPFAVEITNEQISFKDGSSTPAHINNDSLHITKANITTELRLGNFVWKLRENGNLGLIYEG